MSNIARILKTTLPSLALVLLGVSSTNAQERPMTRVIDFGAPQDARWTIVNDGVMGGRSSSSLEATDDGTAMFSGFLSLENNGGFASVRALFRSLDLTGHAGLRLRVRGDGRSYQVRIRTSGTFDGVSYASEFQTNAGEWTEVFLPFSSFVPTFRGRVPRGVPPLNVASIRQIGFLLGDKNEGPFSLEIAWVGAVPEEG